MKFERLLTLVGHLVFSDLPRLVQLAGGSRASLRTQVYRWSRQGKVIPLRRGAYVLAAPYRRVEAHPAVLANQIHRPSYLSFHWALGYYGLIPERAVVYTSTITRVPRRFENALGRFRYIHVKKEAFFGYRSVRMEAHGVLIASPEKALLDLWPLEKGPWTADRMAEMRFQNPSSWIAQNAPTDPGKDPEIQSREANHPAATAPRVHHLWSRVAVHRWRS